MLQLLDGYPELWGDDAVETRETIKSYLLSVGTDLILTEKKELASTLAGALMSLENFTPPMTDGPMKETSCVVTLSDNDVMKLKDIMGGCERTCIRYYWKRTLHHCRCIIFPALS